MIDEKMLIKILSKNSIFEKITNAEGKNVFGIIESLPKFGEWIPCSDRLPEQDEKSEYYASVIVTLDNGRVAEGCYRNYDKEWWVDAPDGEHFSEDMTGHVLAWQPLPEAYKGEQE